MSNILKIEMYKIFKSKTIYVIISLILLFSFLFLIVVNKKTSDNITLENNYIFNENYSEEYNKIIDKNILKNKFYVNNEGNKTINLMNNTYTIVMIEGLLMIYFAASIYPNEVKSGTITNYISKPFKRCKVYYGKYITLVIISLVILLLILLENILLCTTLCNINILKVKDIFISNNETKIINYLLSFIIKYFIVCIPILFIITLTYVLSYLTKSKSVSLIISNIIFIFSPVLSTFLFKNNIKFIEYTFLPYLDFNSMLNELNLFYTNTMYNTNINIKNGIITLIIYAFLFLIIGLIKFKKEEY